MEKKVSISKKAVTSGKYNAPFPQRLRALMENDGITQVMIATEIGVTPQTVYQYVNGISEPSYANLVKIAAFLDTTTDYLLGRTNIRSQDANIQTVQEYTYLSEHSIKKLKTLYFLGYDCEIMGESTINKFIECDAFEEFIRRLTHAFNALHHWKENEPYRKQDLQYECSVTEYDTYLGQIHRVSSITQDFIEQEVEKHLAIPTANADNTPATDADHQEV